MRNKTLLIRRHLIHYWHLSNQTTFHKTLFSHSDDEDRKIERGKYASWLLVGIQSRYFQWRERSKKKNNFPMLITNKFSNGIRRETFLIYWMKRNLKFNAKNCSELRVFQGKLPNLSRAQELRIFLSNSREKMKTDAPIHLDHVLLRFAAIAMFLELIFFIDF